MMREGWIEIKYKNVVDKISTSKQKIKQKEYLTEGKYPVIDQGQELIGGYTDDKEKLLSCTLPALVFGDHTKVVKLINFKFAPGADGTKVLTPKQMVLPKYLVYVTQVLVLKIQDKGYARHYQHIEKQEFFLPPLPEQRAIVAKIEQLFSELDNGIDNLKKAKEKLEIYRQAVLKKAFEGELTKEWREQKSGSRKDWKQRSLGEVLMTIDGDRGKNYPKKGELHNEGYCLFLSTKNVRKGKFVFEENLFITKEKDIVLRGGKLIRNDVVVTTRGTLGNVALYDQKVKYENIRINSGMLILRVNNPLELDPTFLMRFINSSIFLQQLKSKQSGTAQPQIPAGILREIEIEIPNDVNEQTQIIHEVETRLSVCDNILANLDEGLEKAEALRQSILKKSFEGRLLSKEELEACRREPDWEPAEKLLERIKQERNEEV